MKFSCQKGALSEALGICVRAISSRNVVTVLEGFLITAKEDITICGYDLKTSIRCTIEAEIQTPGALVLNARIFSDIVRKLPSDSVEISVDEKMVVTIRGGHSEFYISAQSASEFPELPEVLSERAVTVPENMLKSMIAQTIFAVSDNENKPIHTGSLFEISESLLTIVSVDGYRLAIRKEKLSGNKETCSFVVPGEALKEIERILGERDDEVFIYPDKKHILFNIGNVIIVSRLLEGEFLNYKNAIPGEGTLIVTANVHELIDCIDRVSLLISERLKNPVRCLFSEGMLKFSSITAIGRAFDECELEGMAAEDLEIGFNNRYLLDAFKACKEDRVVLSLKSNLSPLVITPEQGDAFLYLVLPVRLRGNE